MTVEAWIEAGIGETRAAVTADDRLIEVHIERDDDGLRHGEVWAARLTGILVPHHRGIVRAGDFEALLEPLPTGVTEGALLRVAVVREALPEAGRPRLAKVRAEPGAATHPARLVTGADLAARLRARGMTVRPVAAHDTDRLEAAGWSEAVDAARSGHVPFPGGLLTITPTPAMTVIDVDGPGDAGALALAAAAAVGAAVRRFDLGGSIGVDFPTVDRAHRIAIGERLDAALPPPFERTAVNGFGFVQIVRPRLRPSFIERVRGQPVATAALWLLRSAERARGAGTRLLTADPAVVAWLAARPALTDALERRCGCPVRLQADAALAISSGHVATLA